MAGVGRDWTYPSVIRAARAAMWGLGQKFDIEGAEHIPRRGGVLLACNHISYTDFIYAGYAALPAGRLVRFMAKQELFTHKVSGPLMRSMHHIPVDRGAGTASVRQAMEYLRAGEAVGIFPEATISRAFVLKDIKSGAIRIAADSGVPIVPMALFGTHRLMTKGQKTSLTRGRTIVVRIGEPMNPTGEDAEAETAELARRMSALIEAAVKAYPEDGTGQPWYPAQYGGSAPTLEEAKQLDVLERAARIARKRKGR